MEPVDLLPGSTAAAVRSVACSEKSSSVWFAPALRMNGEILCYHRPELNIISPYHSYLRSISSSSTGADSATRSGGAAVSESSTTSEAGAAVAAAAGSLSSSSSESSTRRVGVRRGPVTWGSLLLLILTGGGLVAYYDYEKKRRLQSVKQLQPVGTAAIGGPFTLVNHEGRTVTDQDLKGSWNLIYFGFTLCPDICPAELEKMAEAVDLIEKKGNGLKIRPVFISVDPERDTVEQVGLYTKEFHPRLVGLTGSVEAVRHAARAYRVYYMKTEEEGDDYLVDHSIIMYLMDPEMNFVKFYGKNYTAESLSDAVIQEIETWKKSR